MFVHAGLDCTLMDCNILALFFFVLFLFCLNCNGCWSLTIRGRCIGAKCGIGVFLYWVLFLVCTLGVALMLPEVKSIKEASKLPRGRGGFEPEGQTVFDRCGA